MSIDEEMYNKAPFISRLVASSVRISETAGQIIKAVMDKGDLQIVDKGVGGVSDPQTEADRRAQYCIVQSLQTKFSNLKIVGEEETTSECPELVTDFDRTPLSLNVSDELKLVKEDDVVVWVDPLDGTSEIAAAHRNKDRALLEQVTVLIGIAYKERAIAGIIHQPYYKSTGRTIWAIEGCGVNGITPTSLTTSKTVVTTRSHLSESVLAALEALKQKGLADNVRKVGGAGYKVLQVLEGSAAYVFASQGCKKWDTCAVEAILKASGGTLTDISGRRLRYHADVQRNNTGGVLATANWVQHQDYVDAIPQVLKETLPEFAPRL